jgi:hypothetical protein
MQQHFITFQSTLQFRLHAGCGPTAMVSPYRRCTPGAPAMTPPRPSAQHQWPTGSPTCQHRDASAWGQVLGKCLAVLLAATACTYVCMVVGCQPVSVLEFVCSHLGEKHTTGNGCARTLSLTVPLVFMAAAACPVRHAPTYQAASDQQSTDDIEPLVGSPDGRCPSCNIQLLILPS